jgi:hypothetical protein
MRVVETNSFCGDERRRLDVARVMPGRPRRSGAIPGALFARMSKPRLLQTGTRFMLIFTTTAVVLTSANLLESIQYKTC